MRPHLDYSDITYDQPNKESPNQKIERTQYNAALAITGTYTTYQSRLYNALALGSLKFRRWFRKLSNFYKIKTTGVPEYLSDLIPQINHLYNTCAADDVTTFYSRTNAFKYSLFQYTVSEWNKLDWNIQQSKTMLSFRNSLLKTG